jgi:hypothetical protein
VFVRDVAGRTGVYFPKSYVGFAEFMGTKILYAFALAGFKTEIQPPVTPPAPIRPYPPVSAQPHVKP